MRRVQTCVLSPGCTTFEITLLVNFLDDVVCQVYCPLRFQPWTPTPAQGPEGPSFRVYLDGSYIGDATEYEQIHDVAQRIEDFILQQHALQYPSHIGDAIPLRYASVSVEGNEVHVRVGAGRPMRIFWVCDLSPPTDPYIPAMPPDVETLFDLERAKLVMFLDTCAQTYHGLLESPQHAVSVHRALHQHGDAERWRLNGLWFLEVSRWMHGERNLYPGQEKVPAARGETEVKFTMRQSTPAMDMTKGVLCPMDAKEECNTLYAQPGAIMTPMYRDATCPGDRIGNSHSVFMALGYPDTDEDALLISRQVVDSGIMNHFRRMRLRVQTRWDHLLLGRNIDQVRSRQQLNTHISSVDIMHLDPITSLPRVGQFVRPDEIWFCELVTQTFDASKVAFVRTHRIPDKPAYTGQVVRVEVAPLPNSEVYNLSITLTIGKMEGPEPTDKIAGVHAEKGTLTRIVPTDEMPFVQDTGVVPQMIASALSVFGRSVLSHVTIGIATQLAIQTGNTVQRTEEGAILQASFPDEPFWHLYLQAPDKCLDTQQYRHLIEECASWCLQSLQNLFPQSSHEDDPERAYRAHEECVDIIDSFVQAQGKAFWTDVTPHAMCLHVCEKVCLYPMSALYHAVSHWSGQAELEIKWLQTQLDAHCTPCEKYIMPVDALTKPHTAVQNVQSVWACKMVELFEDCFPHMRNVESICDYILCDGKNGRTNHFFVSMVDICENKHRGNRTYYTSEPVRDPVTKDSIKRRSEGGQPRIGYMEQMALISANNSKTLTQLMLHDGDGCIVHMCATCGCLGTLRQNTVSKQTECCRCRHQSNVMKLQVPYSLVRETLSMMATNICITFEVRDNEEGESLFIGDK